MTPSIAANKEQGLTSAEAQARLKQFGPNAVVEEKPHPFQQFIRRFWAPIPWLLEASIIIQLFLGEKVEAAVIGGSLVLILSSQAGVYLLRERGYFWKSRPGRFLVASSVLGLGVMTACVLGGTLMPAINPSLLLAIAVIGGIYFGCTDWVKVWLFRRLDLR
jgi:uncharacterized membrane protein YfbV (UPF0208 family)